MLNARCVHSQTFAICENNNFAVFTIHKSSIKYCITQTNDCLIIINPITSFLSLLASTVQKIVFPGVSCIMNYDISLRYPNGMNE